MEVVLMCVVWRIDDAESHNGGYMVGETVMEEVKEVLDGLHGQGTGGALQHVSPAIASFDCMPDLCVFVHRSYEPKVQNGKSDFHTAAMAQKPVTDKIAPHNYDLFYEKYLNSIHLGGRSIAPYDNQCHLPSFASPIRYISSLTSLCSLWVNCKQQKKKKKRRRRRRRRVTIIFTFIILQVC
jgi:hypothetical protein